MARFFALVFSLLILMVCSNGGAADKTLEFAKSHNSTSPYWAMGQVTKPDGTPSSAFMFGKREWDAKTLVTTDNQFYILKKKTAEEDLVVEHYTYVFEPSKKKADSGGMTVLLAGKKVGEGAFSCKPKDGYCEYNFEVKGEGAYTARGKDFFGDRDTGVFYSENSDQLDAGQKNPTNYKANYYPISEATFQEFQKRFPVLKK